LAEQRELLPSHCTVLSGHLQKPVDVLQTLSPMQGSHVRSPVHTPFTQVWLLPHGLVQPPQCWVLVFVLVSQVPSPLQSAVPVAQVTTQAPGATHACCEAQYSVPFAHGRHFFFFRLQRPEQQSLPFRQGLAPGGRQVAVLTASVVASPLAGCTAVSRAWRSVRVDSSPGSGVGSSFGVTGGSSVGSSLGAWSRSFPECLRRPLVSPASRPEG